MSIAFLRKLEELMRRMEAAECRLTVVESERAKAMQRRVAGLQEYSKARKARGEALKAEIAAILETHQPRRLKAFAVLTFLKCDHLPSLRRVQEIMRELKSATTYSAAYVHAQQSTALEDRT